ncbi:PAS domain S-box protein [Pedobacter frigiditerrae]|uniref:histidine kinase n=1 Tax=Pedobacter frigiditerrae TaxID=2530452 RepID=A0A4R0MMQ9_9SPHI|nr:PAS domain S-box protein [Pedobacter frigiditerrae]TCC88031.1 PAS domain S-box protein [Pedobacter frigiditerrae]
MEEPNHKPNSKSSLSKDQTNPSYTSEEQQINAMIESAPFPIAVYIGKEMRIIRANQAVIEVWGKGPDVIGKTFKELLPELAGTGIYQHLDEVYNTGVPFNIRNSKVKLTINGELKEFYFNYSFTPLFDDSGKVYGVMNTAADVTDLNLAKQHAEFSETNFRNMILQAPLAMSLLRDPAFVVDLVNDAMLDIWGKSLAQVTGKPVFEALPDAKEQGLEQVMEAVYRTGEPFFANETPVKLIRHGKEDTVYQNFVYQAYRDSYGAILGVLAISVNVSEQVRARMELEKAYEQIQLSKTAAQLGTFDLDLEKGTMEWDERCRELFGIAHRNQVTYEQDFVQGLHPEDKERIVTIIDQLLTGKKPDGNYDVEYRTIGQEDQQIRWVRAKGKVYHENNKPKRFIGSVLDITNQKQNEQRLLDLSEKQARLAALVNSSDDIIISKTLEGIITSWNPAAERAFGFTEAEAIGCHISIVIPKNRLNEEDYILGQIRNGNKVDHFETVRYSKGKQEIHLSLTVSPVVDHTGKVIGASKIARDITQQKITQQRAKKYTVRLEIMNMVMSAISEELDLNKILQKVTDATTELTGASFGAFFYNKMDAAGESYTLFTLSGAPREAFEKFGMPRNTAVFHPTFSGEGVVRVDDITKDPRYGKNDPHFGMPKGHLPVVSYLAVPVISRNGHVIGGLFFGHPEPAMFNEEHEALVISIAAQAAISLDNAKLFEEVRALNDKKDEFIGLASHELKTPLASINGYLQILDRQIKEEGPKKFLQKALNQVGRITSLVNDLLDVSKIEAGKLQLTRAEFDLKYIVEEAIELIQQSEAKHNISFKSELAECPVQGDAQRIEQVIVNLLSNAIKYAPKANKVEVALTCTAQKVTVSVRDFGPGIAKDKLKNIFTRFYRIDEASPNISGLGIGLYLAHEIITRHNGEIWAESELGAGSTFFFSLPRHKN